MDHSLERVTAGRGWTAALARGGGLCAVPGVGGSADGTTAEFLPIAIVLAAFTGVAVWMFRRWGGQAASEPATAPIGDARPANA